MSSRAMLVIIEQSQNSSETPSIPRACCECVLRHGRLLLSVSHMKCLQKRSFKRHAGSFGRQKHEGTRRALQTVIESTNFAACGEAIGGMRTIPHPIFVLSPTDRLRTGAALP